ncbi:MAG TPA: TonB-dependent receptor [Candidatus Saccharicenans sp.]|nr:TonB-dependent receptor [Candidatus Saccharicenans sp.]
MKDYFKCLFLMVGLLSLLSGVFFSQTRETGIIQGCVFDEEGNILPGATLALSSQSLMGDLHTQSDQKGQFRFAALLPGQYTIEVSLPGFLRMKKTNIVVNAGMTTTVNIILKIEKISEEMLVVSEAPPIDVTDSSVSKAYLTRDTLEKLPTNRDVFNILNYAPGVASLSSYGSGDHTGNRYQIDGVDISDAWFGGGVYSSKIDYDTIEEVQFLALGAPAEYGNFTGANINVITKSGGNNFSGDIRLSYRDKSFQSNNINSDDPKWSLLSETPKTQMFDSSISFGGPIIRDKLWYYAGFNYIHSSMEWQAIDKTRPSDFPKGNLKLTYQPNRSDRFVAFVSYHKSTEENMDISPLVANEANYKFVYPVWIFNLSFLHSFSSNSFLELKYTGNYLKNKYIPNSGRDLSGHYDLITGEQTVNCTWWGDWESNRSTINASFTHFADNFIKGSHQFKLGIEIEKSDGGGESHPTGGIVYYDLNGEPYQAESWGTRLWGENWRFTGYIQDSWSVSKSLVINPGLRYTLIRGKVPDLQRTVYKPENLEPRIGLNWIVGKNQKTVLKAHYGRYFEGTKVYYFSDLTPSPDTITYLVGPEWSSLTELYRIPGGTNYDIDPNVKHPYMDQLTAGLEHTIGQSISLGIAYIYRHWKNFIEPVNITAIFEEVPFTDPESGQIYYVYNQLNPGDDRYYITNPKVGVDYGQAYPDIVQEEPYRKYRGLQFVFKKRFSNNWQSEVSYVYAKEEGTYGNSHAGDVQRSWMGHQTWNMCGATLYLDPTTQINLKGRSIISPRNVFKAYFSYLLPWDISLSLFYQYVDGRRWERNLLIDSVNQSPPYLMTEPRGSRGLSATNQLDLSIEKAFRFKNSKFSIMLDVFNVFNQGRMVAVNDVVGPNFGKAMNVNDPRVFRTCVKFNF